jgi:hypothetical protein
MEDGRWKMENGKCEVWDVTHFVTLSDVEG